jgi:anti-sigma B factor antagonist
VGVPGNVVFDIEESGAGESRVLTVRGELDLETSPALRQHLHRAIDSGQREVTVDVSGLTFLDSTAISVLVDGQKQLRRIDGRLILRDPTSRTRRILEIAGLLEFFEL